MALQTANTAFLSEVVVDNLKLSLIASSLKKKQSEAQDSLLREKEGLIE